MRSHTGRRAVLAALAGWGPMAAITIAQFGVTSPAARSFWADVAVHSRFLVCVPLLVYAHTNVVPRLSAIAHHFTEAGLITPDDRGRFDAALIATHGRFESPARYFVIIPLAYVFVTIAVISRQHEHLPEWHQSIADPQSYSVAGWWHVLASAPLLIVLVLGWFWRLMAWAWLLRRLARLDLQLVASHPDHCAGLAFVGNSLRAFASVALALSTLLAGQAAQLVLRQLPPPLRYVHFTIGALVVLVLAFTAPLLAFMPKLFHVWRRASFEYGALAHEQGQAFERHWLGDTQRDDRMLGVQDFSATTDLYQIVSNVYAIRFVPVGLKDVLALSASMLVPFVPVLLMTVPLTVIWSGIRGLLL